MEPQTTPKSFILYSGSSTPHRYFEISILVSIIKFMDKVKVTTFDELKASFFLAHLIPFRF